MFLKTIPQAAATTCYVATYPRLENVSGKYLADCNEASIWKLGSNSTEAGRQKMALFLPSQVFSMRITAKSTKSDLLGGETPNIKNGVRIWLIQSENDRWEKSSVLIPNLANQIILMGLHKKNRWTANSGSAPQKGHSEESIWIFAETNLHRKIFCLLWIVVSRTVHLILARMRGKF
ncbi:unnamed protein product [Camellia sinensis]